MRLPVRVILAMTVLILSGLMALPAQAGRAELELLTSYIGKWSGAGVLVGGKAPEPFRCRMTIAKGSHTKINYSGRCTLVNMNLSVAGTIAYDDAAAYAAWLSERTGQRYRLLTESEFEYAARAGTRTAFFWGETADGACAFANARDAAFNTAYKSDVASVACDDGAVHTAPAGSYAPNPFGLYDMAGNVWQWTTDWYQDHDKMKRACCTIDNRGSVQPDESYDPRTPKVRIPRRVMKGGSYLCAPNYCHRYRPAARMAQPVDTATCHLGFRGVVRPDA